MTERSPHSLALEAAAERVDDSRSWQFLAGRSHPQEDAFMMHVVSRGPIPLIEASDFEGIEACVTIDRDPGDSFSKLHIIEYQGDEAGLEMFVGYLTGPLDGRSEGNIDPIRDFVGRNPLWALDVFGRRAQS